MDQFLIDTTCLTNQLQLKTEDNEKLDFPMHVEYLATPIKRKSTFLQEEKMKCIVVVMIVKTIYYPRSINRSP